MAEHILSDLNLYLVAKQYITCNRGLCITVAEKKALSQVADCCDLLSFAVVHV